MNKDDKNKTKVERAKKRRITLITIISVVVISIVAAIIYVVYHKLNYASFEQYEMYQYFSGLKVEYNGTLTLNYKGGITELAYDDVKIEADSTPIYFKTIQNEVVFPKNMELIIPRLKNRTYKINYFSKVGFEEYGGERSSYLVYRDKSYYLEPSFLFNGENMYFFNYGAEVKVEGKEMTLSPLSYMLVDYRGEIEIYDKKSDKYTMIDSSKEDAMAEIDGCTINLSTDTVFYPDGGSRLLVKNIDKLPVFEGSN